jgi:DNA-binding transcriptional ArsR family regulator
MGSDEEGMLELVHRFTFDSMPMTRVQILRSLAKGRETAKEIHQDVRMSVASISRHLEDLWYLKLVENDMGKHVIIDDDLVAMLEKA